MADTPSTTTSDINQTNEIIDQSSNIIGGLNDAVSMAGKSISFFQDKLKNISVDMQNNNALLQHNTHQYSLLTSAALSSSKAFDAFLNVDTSNLTTIKEQFTEVVNIISSGDSGLSNLTNFISNAFGKKVPDDIKNSLDAVKNFALKTIDNFAQTADNGLKLQNAFLQLSAKTGNLGTVMNLAGNDLQNMNKILASQNKIIDETSKATSLNTVEVVKYYSQLGKIPGTLDSVISLQDDNVTSMNMMTAALKLAMGTGRDNISVINDISSSYKNYNATGQTALQFTARISEISQKYKIELEEVQKAANQTASSFNLYGASGANAARMLEGTANIMNNYIGALQESGLSGAEAANTISNITTQLSRLDIAQKSFLSSQTGGPGGLMGAFQIEKLMQEGKIDEVMEKVRKTMMKQFGGRIVSLEEATTSQGAASQLTKQMLMLKQGPLGQFARTDQDALRIIDAFTKREKTPTTQLSTSILEDSINKGTKVQELSTTETKEIKDILQSAQLAAIVPSLNVIQQTIGARTGNQLESASAEQTAAQMARRNQLQIETAKTKSTTEIFATAEKEPTTFMDESASMIQNLLSTTASYISDRLPMTGSAITSGKSLFITPTTKQPTEKELDQQLQNKQKEPILQTIPITPSIEQFNPDRLKTLMEQSLQTNQTMNSPSNIITQNIIQTAKTIESKNVAETNQNIKNTNIQQQQQQPLTIALSTEVHGICVKCHKDMIEDQAQSKAITQGTIT